LEKRRIKDLPILISLFQNGSLPALFSLRANQLRHLFGLQQAGEGRAVTVYLLGGGLAVLLLVVSMVVRRVRNAQRRKALAHLLERYQSGQALVRYVQLNRHCSEEEAYQRLACYVKHHLPFEDHGSIDKMVAQDRPGLLERVRSLLVHDPDQIDTI
jgi:hypothetical protein